MLSATSQARRASKHPHCLHTLKSSTLPDCNATLIIFFARCCGATRRQHRRGGTAKFHVCGPRTLFVCGSRRARDTRIAMSPLRPTSFITRSPAFRSCNLSSSTSMAADGELLYPVRTRQRLTPARPRRRHRAVYQTSTALPHANSRILGLGRELSSEQAMCLGPKHRCVRVYEFCDDSMMSLSLTAAHALSSVTRTLGRKLCAAWPCFLCW